MDSIIAYVFTHIYLFALVFIYSYILNILIICSISGLKMKLNNIAQVETKNKAEMETNIHKVLKLGSYQWELYFPTHFFGKFIFFQWCVDV